MNKKTKVIISLIVGLVAIGGTIHHFANDKKAYDYSDYYQEAISPTEKEDVEIIEEKKDPDMVFSLSLLKQTNPDIRGIIEFDNRIIYEPVVQAPDNKFYERKNIDLNYAAAGIPFISCDGNIDSTNVVIYGHSSTRSNIIFTPLMNYIDESYYKKHPTFTFETENGKRTYEIFSVFGFDTRNLDDSLEFMQSSWRKVTDYQNFIKETKERNFYQTNVDITSDDKLMTLVTCDTRDNNKRIVVVARLIANNE